MLIYLAIPALLSSVPQLDVLEADTLVYIVNLAGGEMGRETVTLREDGWDAEGSFDFMGQRKGEYTASMIRTEDNWLEYELTTSDRGRDISFVAAFGDGELSVKIEGIDPQMKMIEGEGCFFYDDLLWANMIDLGREFVMRDDAGKLSTGTKLTAISALQAIGFPIEYLETVHTEQMVADQRVAFRGFRYKINAQVEFFMVCKPDGIPVRIEIPSQGLSVEAQGFEHIHGTATEPTSIVDSGPWRAKLSEASHEVTVEKAVAVKMRDGVELIVDIYRPKAKGKHPTILARTPYNRLTEGALKGSWYAKRGYAFVAQDVRGRFDSAGEWFPFINETNDGSDTIDWIAEQPWSDGAVGMIGASYVGMVQWLAAKSGNAHLKCIVPQVSPPDPQENFPYEGGTMLLGAAWWAKVLDAMKHGTDWKQGTDWEAMYATLPLGNLDKKLGLKEANTFLDEWLSHPPHDLEFWEPSSYQDAFDRMSVPALHISGWWDGDQPGAVQNYAGMRANAKTKAAREHQYLVMGPWTHFFNTQRAIGHVDYGDEAVIDLDARTLRFFDRHLKGVDNGIDNEPPVHVFTMGSNRWSSEADWPLPQTKFTKLYLQSDGKAHQRDGDGRMGLKAGRSGVSNTYRYDPHDLPELDVDFTDTSGAGVTKDRSEDPDRDDDIEFTTPPLAVACEVVGPVEAVLWVSTDAADTDFFTTLYRQTAKGELYLIRYGVQRLRYAANPKEDRPVSPGEVTRVAVDMWATGTRLEKGDRLVLQISSWSWPSYARNLNTLEDVLVAEKGVVANNTVYHSREYPSHLLLPVVPREDAPGLAFEE